MGVEPWIPVLALELQLPAGGLADGEHRLAVAAKDRSPLDVVFLVDQPDVRRILRDALRREHLQVVQLGEQDQEQRQEGHAEPADLAVHASSPARASAAVARARPERAVDLPPRLLGA